MTNLIGPLGDGLRQAYEVHLLKRIGAQGRDGHLTSNDNDGGGVEHGVGDTRQRVSHTRTAGDQGNTYLARDACIALGSVGGTLFVAHQYVVETFLLTSCIVEKRIVNGHDAAARVTKDGFHALGLQRPHQRLRSCNLISHLL